MAYVGLILFFLNFCLLFRLNEILLFGLEDFLCFCEKSFDFETKRPQRSVSVCIRDTIRCSTIFPLIILLKTHYKRICKLIHQNKLSFVDLFKSFQVSVRVVIGRFMNTIFLDKHFNVKIFAKFVRHQLLLSFIINLNFLVDSKNCVFLFVCRVLSATVLF